MSITESFLVTHAQNLRYRGFKDSEKFNNLLTCIQTDTAKLTNRLYSIKTIKTEITENMETLEGYSATLAHLRAQAYELFRPDLGGTLE